MIKRHNKKGRNNKDPSDLVSYGDFILPPVVPGPEVIDLCSRIDSFYSNYSRQHKRQKPSDLIKGAFYAARPECRSNPDWMSQAANSARDVLYPLFSESISSNNLIKLFKKYAINQTYRSRISNKEFVKTFDNLDKIYKQLSDLTHHGTELKGFSEKQFVNFSENDFESLLKNFIFVLERAFALQQIYIHTIIDLIVQRKRRVRGVEEVKNDIYLILNVNFDARQYFYTKADERWLGWLWKKGFLDVVKQKAEDPTRYSYRTPELNYLVRMTEKKPKEVTDIILAIPISKEIFNPEVIDQFLRICSSLPAEQLARVVSKIRNENWIPLMGVFNQWGFEYEKMFKTLTDTDDFDSALILAEAVLSVRTKKESEQDKHEFLFDSPFYFKELSYTKVFEYLLKVNKENTERALTLVIDIIKKVVLFEEKEGRDEVFEVYDGFFLLDVDFFDLKLSERNLSHETDIKNLAAVIAELTKRIINSYDTGPLRAKKLYEKYFKPLPDSRSMWRLKLFIFSLCPDHFKDELKSAFFRLFSVERYYDEIISGKEYMKTLRAGFSVLSDIDKRDYVRRVIKYFVKKDKGKENEKEDWHIKYGSKILSMITNQLTEEEKQTAQAAGFILNPDYDPEPSIDTMRGGYVRPRGPIDQEEFDKLPIAEIAKKLRSKWTPEALRNQNTSNNFLSPLNADGAGELLRNNITKRLQEYVDNAGLFFERDVLDQHYTYSFLWGIQELIRGKKSEIDNINWDNLMSFFVTIKQSGEEKSFDNEERKRGVFDTWLSSWIGVHSAMTDVIQELLSEEDGSTRIDFSKYRNELFGILSYLLNHSYPEPADEEPKTAVMTITSPGEKESAVGDPYSIAINTVRGRAFQVFVLFVYQDGKKFSKEEVVKISSDVKGLYETVLKNEKTRALMFMFGHHLPSFYFRDKKWMQELFAQIFPTESEKKHLYTAAWEGYLSANLYKELFFDQNIQKLYEKALDLTDKDYPKQEHFTNPDNGVATHFALAFIYFSEFDSEHNLFKKFWNTKNLKRHKEFISFIGRHSISREAATEWIKYNKIDIEKLKKFWDWALEYCDTEAMTGFGFWINTEHSVLETKWLANRVGKTLEKTNGYIEWNYGLMRSLITFAKEAPKDTLTILNFHLFKEVAEHEPIRTWLYMNNEISDAFKELYKNKKTKREVHALINNLLSRRNGMFWELKSILDNKDK